MFHSENITSLISEPKEQIIENQRYRSKHEMRVRHEIASAKYAHRTFGLPSVPLNPPSKFLKKKSRNVPQKHVKHVHYRRPGYQHKLPEWTPMKAIPKSVLEELPKDPVTLGRINFRKENISNVKKTRPPEPVPRMVDSRFGDVQDLRKCGLMPLYITKKYFGKSPPKPKKPPQVKQLKHMKNPKQESEWRLRSGSETAGSVSSEDERKQKKPNETKARYVTEDEREELLHGMKKNWEEMMNRFQRLPFLIDTPPKVKRKVKLENDLKQLEKDIEFIERHRYIYVHDDEE